MTKAETHTINVSPRRLWTYHVDLPEIEAFAAVQESENERDENGRLVRWPLAEALGWHGLERPSGDRSGRGPADLDTLHYHNRWRMRGLPDSPIYARGTP